MVEKTIEYLVDFAARTLHYIVSNKVSHDIAFKRALKDMPRAAQHVKLRTLYKVSRMIVVDYYLLEYASQKIYGGSKQPLKRVARLWLTLRLDDVVEIDPSIEPGLRRLQKRIVKTMPRRVESVDELLDEIEEPLEKLAIKYSFPKWFVERMSRILGLNETEKLLSALNEEQWWIRVNTQLVDVDTIVERLSEKGVVVQKDPHLPYMLRVIDYAEPLHHLEEMWEGLIVFQDKASAMVVEALKPEPGDIVLDLAAAPGVKDTLIAQLTNGRVRIIAVDVSFNRAKRIKKLAKMYGFNGVEVDIVNADARQLPVLLNPTKVLLDAPCTSSGAIGKDPAIKLHLNDLEWVTRFPRLQRELLSIAASFKAETVYATCSLLPEEGEEQVKEYVERLEPADIPSSKGYPHYPFNDRVHRFLPHIHGTQGFFIARLAARN